MIPADLIAKDLAKTVDSQKASIRALAGLQTAFLQIPKRQIPGLDARVASIMKGLGKLEGKIVYNLTDDGKVSFKISSGEALSTVALLRRGTAWFDGLDTAVDTIIKGAAFGEVIR